MASQLPVTLLNFDSAVAVTVHINRHLNCLLYLLNNGGNDVGAKNSFVCNRMLIVTEIVVTQ